MMSEWAYAKEAAPEAGKQWDGKTFCLVVYPEEYESQSQRGELLTSIGARNRILRPEPGFKRVMAWCYVTLPAPIGGDAE